MGGVWSTAGVWRKALQFSEHVLHASVCQACRCYTHFPALGDIKAVAFVSTRLDDWRATPFCYSTLMCLAPQQDLEICFFFFFINELLEHTHKHTHTESKDTRRLIAHATDLPQTTDLFLYISYIGCALQRPPHPLHHALLPDGCLLHSAFFLPAYFGMSTPPFIRAAGNPSYCTLLQNDFISVRKWEMECVCVW